MLNGVADNFGISESTRATVAAEAERLGYRANHAAQSLRRRRTEIVTVLVQDLANPWFTDLAVAARAAAEARGYTLNVVGAGPVEAEVRALERLAGGSSDGVIVATGRHSARGRAIDALRELVRGGTPAVLLDRPQPRPVDPGDQGRRRGRRLRGDPAPGRPRPPPDRPCRPAGPRRRRRSSRARRATATAATRARCARPGSSPIRAG